MKRRWVLISGLLLAAVLIVRIVMLITDGGAADRPSGSTKPPVAVEIGMVDNGPIQDVREFTGSIHAQYQYVVAPKVSGRVIEIRKRLGDPVARGEVLVRIDDGEYQQAEREARANLRISQASLSEAESQFALAKQELERAQSLSEKGIASEAEFDTATSNFAAQQSRLQLWTAQIEQREAALKTAEIQLSHTILSAPEPGFVGERYIDEGSLLSPNAPVMSIVGIDKVIVRTTIVERDYGSIHIGQRAVVAVEALPGQRYYGEVVRIAPMLQEASRTAQMEIEIDNGSLALKPGMFARIQVILMEREQAQLVPAQAVVARDGAPGLFLVDREQLTARYVSVELGITTPEVVEVLSPEIEDAVVTLGQHLLTDGSPLLLPKTAEFEQEGGNR